MAVDVLLVDDTLEGDREGDEGLRNFWDNVMRAPLDELGASEEEEITVFCLLNIDIADGNKSETQWQPR